MLAEQHRPPVPQRRKMAKLMPRIRLSYRVGPVRKVVTRKNPGTGIMRQRLRIEPQTGRQWSIDDREPRCGHRHRPHSTVENVWQQRIGMLQPPAGPRRWGGMRNRGHQEC